MTDVLNLCWFFGYLGWFLLGFNVFKFIVFVCGVAIVFGILLWWFQASGMAFVSIVDGGWWILGWLLCFWLSLIRHFFVALWPVIAIICFCVDGFWVGFEDNLWKTFVNVLFFCKGQIQKNTKPTISQTYHKHINQKCLWVPPLRYMKTSWNPWWQAHKKISAKQKAKATKTNE